MIDHVALYVTDIDRSRRFYEQALEAVGYTVAMERESFVGFRQEGGPMFAVRSGKEATATAHIAFQVRDRATVDAFHAALLESRGETALYSFDAHFDRVPTLQRREP